MSETLVKPDVGDAELITAVRGGDVSAYGTLFERHVEAARRLARQLTNTSDADDLVSDAFAKVLRVLQNGGGPDLAFRAYLLTAVRRLHVDKARAGARLTTTDDLEKFDPGIPFRDTAVEGFENSAAAAAFASLPERWQLVLWHTEVEGQKPAEVGELLGMSANSVSALAYRAREGLRQAFLNSHIAEIEDADCRWTHDHLGPYVRNGVSKRDAHKVEEHLDGCRKCMAIYLELTEVNSNLSGILAPIILGAAASGYLAAGAGAVKVGFLAAAAGRVRDGITSNVPLSAAVGVAAVSTVVGVSVAIGLNQGGRVNVADVPPGPAASSSSTPGTTESEGTDPTGPEGNDPSRRTRAGDDATDPSAAAATEPAATADDDASDAASDGSTDPAGSGGSDDPGGSGGNGGTGGNGGNGGTGGTGGPTTGPTDPPTDPTTGPNRAPVITNAEAEMTLEPGTTSVVIDVLAVAGITDDDGDPLVVSNPRLDPLNAGQVTVGSGVNARAAVTGDEGFITYRPSVDFSGVVRIIYTVSDGETSADGVIKVTVPRVNHAPQPLDDTATTGAGQSVTVDVLGNDEDPDGDRLTLVSVENGANGLATIEDNRVVYEPRAEWAGPDTMTYTVTDGTDSATATLTVTTTAAPPTNRAPQPVDDTATTGAGQSVTVDVLTNDNDLDGDALELVSVKGAQHGLVTIEDNRVVYEPEDKWVGSDTMTYTVSDGTDTATATLTVTTTAAPPTNRAPQPVDDTATTGAGQTVTVDVLTNDNDLDGDQLELISVDGAEHGKATVVDGHVLYEPVGGWSGPDTMTYTVSDGTDTATATLTVTTTEAPPVNRAPETVIDSVTTDFETPITVDVLNNDNDLDGDDLELLSVDGAEHGTATVVDGQVRYEPKDEWSGPDTMTYVVSDGTDTSTGRLHVTTLPRPNRAPTAHNDAAGDVTAIKGGSVEFDVVKNDTDPDGDELRIDRVIGTHHGTVGIEGHNLVFTYADDFAGTEEISYVVTDGQYESTATLTVTVVNDAPLAQDDTHEAPVKVGDSATIDVLANDSDPNKDDLTLVGVTQGGNGKVSLLDGKVLYIPNADAPAGPDNFTYTVRDSRGGKDTAAVRVTVARPVEQHDLSVEVLEGGDDGDHVHLTARITGYPTPGDVRMVITGQSVNAVVGPSLPGLCDKVANSWVCDFEGLTGYRHDVPLELSIRGQERALTFTVSALNFEELPGSGANNAANWPTGS